VLGFVGGLLGQMVSWMGDPSHGFARMPVPRGERASCTHWQGLDALEARLLLSDLHMALSAPGPTHDGFILG
jgi:hypothetical protein